MNTDIFSENSMRWTPGVDINNFEPVSFDELISNNRRFKLSALRDSDDVEYYLNKEREYEI